MPLNPRLSINLQLHDDPTDFHTPDERPGIRNSTYRYRDPANMSPDQAQFGSGARPPGSADEQMDTSSDGNQVTAHRALQIMDEVESAASASDLEDGEIEDMDIEDGELEDGEIEDHPTANNTWNLECDPLLAQTPQRPVMNQYIAPIGPYPPAQPPYSTHVSEQQRVYQHSGYVDHTQDVPSNTPQYVPSDSPTMGARFIEEEAARERRLRALQDGDQNHRWMTIDEGEIDACEELFEPIRDDLLQLRATTPDSIPPYKQHATVVSDRLRPIARFMSELVKRTPDDLMGRVEHKLW